MSLLEEFRRDELNRRRQMDPLPFRAQPHDKPLPVNRELKYAIVDVRVVSCLACFTCVVFPL